MEELRRRVDIVDVVSDYVQLRRVGRSFVGLCPFHNERSPSFSVSIDRQMYHCFGCGAGGTVIRFVMDIEGLDFTATVARLAERANLEPPFPLEPSSETSPASDRMQLMRDAHELAAKLYSYILMNKAVGVQALAYLEQRGISRQTMVDFRIGFAPNNANTLVNLLQKRGFPKDLLIESGLALELGDSLVDRFRGRVMIPICDAQGRVVAFGGRTLAPDGKPKYLNSPETPIFRKSFLLFHEHAARRSIRKLHDAVLLEGYMDVISAWQAGVTNAVASLGTSLTQEQAALIRRHVNLVTIAYDGDNAGIQAAERALDILSQTGLESRIVVFPNGADPDDYIRSHGSDAFTRLLRTSAVSSIQFLLRRLREQANLDTALGRNNFLRKALELLHERASPLEMETEISILSQEFQVSVAALKEELAIVAKQSGHQKRRWKQGFVKSPTLQPLPKGYVQAGNRVLQAILLDSSIYHLALERGVDELVLPEQTALLAHLYAFRTEYPEGQPAAFLDYLEDPQLISLASSLLMEDPPELSQQVLEDYLRTIRLHNLESAHKQCLESLVHAQSQGDSHTLEQLRKQSEELQNQIMQLKMPQQKVVFNAGAKEAGRK